MQQLKSPVFGCAHPNYSSGLIPITQPVTTVEVWQQGQHTSNTKQFISSIRLKYADSTYVDIGTTKLQMDPFVSSVAKLIGFRCQFHKLNHADATP